MQTFHQGAKCYHSNRTTTRLELQAIGASARIDFLTILDHAVADDTDWPNIRLHLVRQFQALETEPLLLDAIRRARRNIVDLLQGRYGSETSWSMIRLVICSYRSDNFPPLVVGFVSFLTRRGNLGKMLGAPCLVRVVVGLDSFATGLHAQSMKPCPSARSGWRCQGLGSRVAAQRNLGALYSARGSAPGTNQFVC